MLREVNLCDLELLFSWRNSQEVRSGLFTQEEIEFSSHCDWFDSSIRSPKKKIFIFEMDGHPCGFAQLDLQPKLTDVYEWGFYKAPDAVKGTGYRMLCEVLRYAFVTLRAEKVVAKVLGYNHVSIRLHERLDFERKIVFENHHFIAGELQDVLVFEIKKSRYFEVSGDLNAD